MNLSKQGFTMIEILLALLVLSLIMQSVYNLVATANRSVHQVNHDETANFQQFLVLLDQELDRYYLEDIGNKRLFIQDPETKQASEIIQNNFKIYKQPGHQPYLYNVLYWDLVYQAPFLEIVVTFKNQQSFKGQIYLGDKSWVRANE